MCTITIDRLQKKPIWLQRLRLGILYFGGTFLVYAALFEHWGGKETPFQPLRDYFNAQKQAFFTLSREDVEEMQARKKRSSTKLDAE